MGRTAIPFLVFILSSQFLLTACVSIPQASLSYPIDEQELSDHVHFLAQPALNGRKPLSLGSRRARRYIKERFEAYGLVPWGDAEGYEQSVTIGTNVVGVLPGADEQLANQIVLVSAHYDHVGKGRLGAADNAAGVAAMLEIAERLSSTEHRPRRSVCFAAFDREETGLFGSFAFTCRDDFHPSKIRAVINIDILGRQLFDVMNNTIFVIGTRDFPHIRQGILESAEMHQIRVLPIGTDIVGPRGDHVAFESIASPCLFFSCGEYGDYHKKGDTPEKISYDELKRSCDVIFETVERLANADTVQQQTVHKTGDRVELLAIKTVISEIIGEYEKVGLTEEDKRSGESLVSQADELLLANEYSVEDRHTFVRDGMTILGPILYRSLLGRNGSDAEETESEIEKTALAMALVQEVMRNHRTAYVEAYRDLVRHVLTHRPIPVIRAMPPFTYVAYDIVDDEISFLDRGGDQCRLSILLPTVSLTLDVGRLTLRPTGNLGCSVQPLDFHGTPGETVDYCLLQWRSDTKDETYGKAWRKILETVTGQKQGHRYDEWLQWRLAQARVSSEELWLLQLLRSGSSAIIAKGAFRLMGREAFKGMEKFEKIAYEVFTNRAVQTNVRAQAIGAYGRITDKQTLLNLADMLDDDTPFGALEVFRFLFDESYPFYDSLWLRHMRERVVAGNGQPENTLSDVALGRLKRLTKKDLGKDEAAWRKWIERNVR